MEVGDEKCAYTTQGGTQNIKSGNWFDWLGCWTRRKKREIGEWGTGNSEKLIIDYPYCRQQISLPFQTILHMLELVSYFSKQKTLLH